MGEDAASDRGETEKERVDRNLYELMAELRVALPGVQVLFAFLLILPFNSRFEQVSPYEEKVYLVTVLCTAVSSLLLIAPTIQHRLQFRADRKERILRHSQRLTVAGLGFLALGMVGALLLITSFVFGAATGAAVAALLALMFALVWWALPLSGRPR